MNRIDRFIVNYPSFEEFRQRMAALSDKDKGDILERLTQVYLQTTPEYRAALEGVWLLRKAPAGWIILARMPRTSTLTAECPQASAAKRLPSSRRRRAR